MERHRVWALDPAMITPWEHRRYIITDHVTYHGVVGKCLFFTESRRMSSSP